jgi:hypothetical protein
MMIELRGMTVVCVICLFRRSYSIYISHNKFFFFYSPKFVSSHSVGYARQNIYLVNVFYGIDSTEYVRPLSLTSSSDCLYRNTLMSLTDKSIIIF